MKYLLRQGSRFLLCMLVAGRVMSFSLDAQISSSGYSSVQAAGYETGNTDVRDSIYIFCNETGSLSATFVEADGNLNFEWSVYNSLLPGFEAPFSTSQGINSQVSNLGSGGYQVRIADGEGLDTIFRAWIFVNSPFVSAGIARHDCLVLDLAGEVDVETFNYWDPFAGTGYSLPDHYAIFWSAEPLIPVSSSRLDPRIWDPPSVVTAYTLRVDYYSCEADYTLEEDPVTTKAGFEFSPREGEAPLEVMFDAGSSQNALEYEWYFDYRAGDLETGQPDAFTPDPVYTYYIPGEYDVTLRTVAGLCDDVFTFPEPVRVLPSELEVPNVFTPDGDDFNEVYMVRAVSLRDFHGIIYNRNGRKVFEWFDPSEGWDGKIDGNTASPGAYFYLITGLGWDDRKFEFTGPLYIYRGR